MQLYNLPVSNEEVSVVKKIKHTKMVKITFQPITAQKPEKELDGDKAEILMPYEHVSSASLFYVACFDIPLWRKRDFFFSDQDAIIRLYQGYFSKTELKAAVGQFAYSTTT